MKPKGTVLLIGGAEDKGEEAPDMEKKNGQFQHFEILKELLPESNQRTKKIEIITTASAIPDEMEKSYKKAFLKIGFKHVGLIKVENKEDARRPDYCKRVEKAHAVLFTGGDQFVLSTILGGTQIMKTIKEKYVTDQHFVIAGTSAGAMAMSKIMIYEGGVNEALLKNNTRMSSGLGVFDTCIIDTHFIKRGRFARLTNAIIMNPEALGIGLGEDTALIIKKGEIAECCGSGSVTVIDGDEITMTNITEVETDKPVIVENLRVHMLAKGSQFSIRDRKFIRSAQRSKKHITAGND